MTGHIAFDMAARLYADLFPRRAKTIDGGSKEMLRITEVLEEACAHGEENANDQALRAKLAAAVEALEKCEPFAEDHLLMLRASYLPGPTRLEAKDIAEAETLLAYIRAALARARGQQ